MKQNRTYKFALLAAVSLHVALVMMLVMNPSTKQPVMALDMKQDMKTPAPEIVKAVSVNSDEVKAVVERLKTERETARKAEEARKQEVVAAAARARARRIKEEARLKHLKQEQAALLAKQKRAAREEQQRVSELRNQKEMELRKLAAMKREQEAFQKKQAEAESREVARLQEEEEKTRREAAQRARMAGVVDKYKALILGAIGQQWILPDRVNTSLSSRFKIRLAPNGAVLDVQLTRSSGDAVLDRSAEAAIYKASPLPVPSEPDMFHVFREISLTVRPENIRG
jgi:colicin import membrane protein